jgi:hypothetical protein
VYYEVKVIAGAAPQTGEESQDNGPRQPMMPGRGEAESSQEANMDQQVLIARNLRGVQVGDTLRVERGQVFKGAEKASFDLTSRVAPDGKYVVRAKCGRAPGDVSYYAADTRTPHPRRGASLNRRPKEPRFGGVFYFPAPL